MARAVGVRNQDEAREALRKAWITARSGFDRSASDKGLGLV